MILPSIDLMEGQAVQLVGGREKVLEVGDPRTLARTFRLAGKIAVVDLDAALGRGHNRSLMRDLIRMAPCRVGGGIRDTETALHWLDEGAVEVVLGTAATPEVLGRLPRRRVIAALDALEGEVVTCGWRHRTGCRVEDRMQALRPLVGGFLVTLVEREGRLGGTDLDRARQLAEAAGDRPLTLAGGITAAAEIAALDRLGIEAQVGRALYQGGLDLAAGLTSCLTSDRADGLWPTVVTDPSGHLLGLAWSDAESVAEAVKRGRGVYHSRRRGLWIKGERSGAIQELLRIDLDCDRDALRFSVRQAEPGFCHQGTWTCFGSHTGGLADLARRLSGLKRQAPLDSFTRRLLHDPSLLARKLLEEAGELAEGETAEEVAWEAADLFYFALVALTRADVPLFQVERELDRRALRVRH
ncbi:MAG: phosphoribosyl-ATP diphosphatase, partial [Acidobacteriota bacterium]